MSLSRLKAGKVSPFLSAWHVIAAVRDAMRPRQVKLHRATFAGGVRKLSMLLLTLFLFECCSGIAARYQVK